MMNDELRRKVDKVLESLEWKYIDREKAEFIYNESRTVQNDITNNMNTLHEKSFQFLTITISILSIIASYLITQFNDLTPLTRVAGICFSLLLSISTVSLVYTVWPREFRFSAIEPGGYFLDEYYKEDMTKIFHGNILVAIDDIDINFQVLEKRAKGLKLGVAFLISAPIASLLLFLVAKAIHLFSSPLIITI